jgi:hypothetical protein
MDMRPLKSTLAIAVGAVCFAFAIYMLISLPGLISDADTIVPLAPRAEASR